MAKPLDGSCTPICILTALHVSVIIQQTDDVKSTSTSPGLLLVRPVFDDASIIYFDTQIPRSSTNVLV